MYGYGAFEVINGRLSIGGLVAFIIYVPRAYIALEGILDGHISTGQAKAAAERIDSLLDLRFLKILHPLRKTLFAVCHPMRKRRSQRLRTVMEVLNKQSHLDSHLRSLH